MENYEAFRKHLENNLADNRTKLNLWKNVKRLSKKDGSDYANFGNNFDGAKVEDYLGSKDALKVFGRSVNGLSWVEDRIELERDATPDIDPERTYRYATYSNAMKYRLTVEETFEKINARIRYFETQVANYKIQLDMSESIYNTVVRTINNLYEGILEDVTKEGYTPTYDIDTPSILYNVMHLFEKAFPPHIKVDKETAATLNKYNA